MDDEPTPATTHDLLLDVAGRVDDDLLAWARELVAVGEDAHAVELLTASLVADRAVLPEPVRAGIVAAARSSRGGLDPGTALPASRSEDGTRHRFAAARRDDPVAAALRVLPARPLQGCRVLLARRTTPAGSAPGPLPHPVVIVVVEPGTRQTDVLAYQLAVALDRSGVRASIEVLAAGGAVPAYHAAALDSAVPIHTGEAAAGGPPAAPDLVGNGRPAAHDHPVHAAATPRSALSATEPAWGEAADVRSSRSAPDVPAVRPPDDAVPRRAVAHGDAPRRPSPLAAVRSPSPEAAPDAPADRPDRDDLPARATPRPAPGVAGRTRRHALTPIPRTVPPSPVPLVGRDASAPAARPLVPVDGPTQALPRPAPAPAPAEIAPEAAAPQRHASPDPAPEHGRSPALAETPTFDLMIDPLRGPLREPLLAPLLDPTIRDDDPLGIAGTPPQAGEDVWGDQWASGSWAMAQSDLDMERATGPGDDSAGDLSMGGSSAGGGRSGASALEGSVPQDCSPQDDLAQDGLAQDGLAQDDLAQDGLAQDGLAQDGLAQDALPPDIRTPGEPPQAGRRHGDSAIGGFVGAPDADAVRSDPALSAASTCDPVRVRHAPDTAEPETAGADHGDDASGFAGADDEPWRPAPRPVPRRAARHRHADEPAGAAPPDPDRTPPPTPVEPVPPTPAHAADARPAAEPPEVDEYDTVDLGLRPESIARLSDADRQLLARLQAELLAGRRPRASHQAGEPAAPGAAQHPATNGTRSNGTRRAGPPELSG